MPLRPCLTCGTPARGSRCPTHQRAHEAARGTTTERGLGAPHQRAAAELLATAEVCHWCARPGTPEDPLTADHLLPRALGGDHTTGYVPAHRSCNSGRPLLKVKITISDD